MGDLMRLRHALGKNLGKELTPEVAVAIEQEVLHADHAIDIKRFPAHAYRGFVFAVERFADIVDELHQQHLAHFAETERYRDGAVMAPDYDYMRWAERAGKLLQFTVRQADQLVGNLRMYVQRDLHTGTTTATEDTLYLAPAARVGFTASRFIDYAERCLAEHGVVDVFIDTKIIEDSQGNVIRDVGALLRRRGYAHVANRFHKNLSKE